MLLCVCVYCCVYVCEPGSQSLRKVGAHTHASTPRHRVCTLCVYVVSSNTQLQALTCTYSLPIVGACACACVSSPVCLLWLCAVQLFRIQKGKVINN